MITTGSGAVKLEGTDNWRNIFDAQNETAEAVDQLTEDMAIIVSGNQTSHTGGAAAGQFVLVRNSTITDITDGLYTAAQAIPANTTIDKTYLTAVSGGALNALNSKLGKQIKSETFTATSNSDSVVAVPTTINGKSTGTASISILSIECTSTANHLCLPFRGTGAQWKARCLTDTGSTVTESSRTYRFYYVEV